MKKFLLAAASLAALTVSASAADMAPRPYTKAPPMVAPVLYTWTGCYIGINGGGGWGRDRWRDQATGIDIGTTSPSGGVIGGQVGCDYQFGGNFVAGIEGMFDWANLNGNGPNPNVATSNNNTRIDFISTVTGRLGLTFGDNRALLYVKGGVAWEHIKDRTFTIANVVSQTYAGQTDVGYTVGAGLEYLFTQNWSGKVEYQHMGFRSSPTALQVGGGTFPRNMTTDIDLVTVGLNYRFGWGR